MTLQEKILKRDILKELVKGVHFPVFCDEEGQCDTINECTDTGDYDCSCCNINRIVKAFNRGIEFQKQKSNWISVNDDLPCNHEELIENENYTKNVLVVLAWNDDPSKKHIEICHMCNKIGSFNTNWYWWNTSYYHVIYWKPLPELPEK